MATDQPSGSDDPGQHPDRHAEQGRQHSPDHGSRPGQDHAPAGTRSRSGYAATVRGTGWGDQSATRPREQQPPAGPREHAPRSGRSPGDSPGPGELPGQSPAQPRQPAAGSDSTREGDAHRTLEPGSGKPGKETGTDSPARHEAAPDTGSHAKDVSTSAETADAPSRGAYADSLRAQDSWRAGGTVTSGTDQRGTASAPEDSGQAGDRSDATRMADPAPSRAEASGAGQAGAAAETGQSHGQGADSPDDQASGRHLPTPDQPAKPGQTRADTPGTASPGEAGTPGGWERQDNEGTSGAGSSGDLAGQADGASGDGETRLNAERPAETTEAGQPADGTSSTDRPPPQADRDRWHAMYQEFLQDTTAGRDQGVNIVGDKPDRSPGDTSDLPPSGEQLLHMEKEEASRFDKFRNELNRDFGDISDVVKQKAETAQQILERPPPIGHPEVAVPAGPQIRPETQAHAIPDVGTVADIGLVLGVVGIQTGRWIRHKLAERQGRS
jgi:hypothetical protein